MSKSELYIEDVSPDQLRMRIRNLRTEIVLAEQKKRGIESAIQARYKSLSRLMAQLAMASPALACSPMSDRDA